MVVQCLFLFSDGIVWFCSVMVAFGYGRLGSVGYWSGKEECGNATVLLRNAWSW